MSPEKTFEKRAPGHFEKCQGNSLLPESPLNVITWFSLEPPHDKLTLGKLVRYALTERTATTIEVTLSSLYWDLILFSKYFAIFCKLARHHCS